MTTVLKNSKPLFNKIYKSDKYMILFNSRTGFEITQGINGNKDPFILDLPSLLDIGIMGSCKNRCNFCYQGHQEKPNMTLDNFKRIIDEVKHHVNQVALGGRGDPNKHENFKEIVAYCRKSGVIPNYTTSGNDLTQYEVEISKLCGAVAVSDYQRSYTFTAISRLINNGIKTNIHYLFHRLSYNRVMNILNGKDIWNNKINIDELNAVIFLLFKPQGEAKNIASLIPTSDQMSSFAKKIFEPECKFKVGMDSCLVNHVLKYSNPTKLQEMSIDTCEGARASAYISPDMKFMPCSFADESLWATDLTHKEIKKLWDSDPIFQKFRSELISAPDKCPLEW